MYIFLSADKTHCDKCSFTLGGEEYEMKEAMDLFEEACLTNFFEPKEDIYIDIDDLDYEGLVE